MMKLRKLWLAGAALALAGLAQAGNQATIYYYTPYKSWSTVYMHYQPTGGTWTTAPGVLMDAACPDWKVKTVDIGTATALSAVFNNGAGSWDNFNNQPGVNYALQQGITQVKNGQITAGASNPCPADATPPTAPTNLAASNLTATTATITWTASTDDIGVTGYEVSVNTKVVGNPTTTSFKLSSLTANTSYTVSVRAKDASGKFSTAATLPIKTLTPDTTPPTTPTGLKGSLNGCTGTLSWTASTDDRGVAKYYIFRNGTRVRTVTAPATSTSTTVKPNTADVYKVQAVDTSNNVSAQSAGFTARVGACVDPQPTEPFRLGAYYSTSKTIFSIWSPDTADVKLWLDGTVYPMTPRADADGYTNVYSVEVPGDHHLKKYNFQVRGITVRDPYGKMVEPGTQNNIVINTALTNLPNGWSARPALVEREDAVIYEVHVRDFSIHSSSGVSAEKRGKYLGMVQAGTTVNGQVGGMKSGIDHLVDMGVTHVQILPFYDFGTCSPDIVATQPGCYNWGYDPVNYNVPEERYSQTPNDPVARMREVKQMVDEFHKRGIRVVMDVVYNHTYVKEMFNNITPKYYTATDLSGTGNSIDAKQAMVARMIRDSLEYWVREYNIDGFRFDLVGIFDYSVYGDWGRYLNQQFPDRNLLIYGEPWNGFAVDPSEATRVRYGTIGVVADAHVGVFNGAYREALKGSSDTGAAGGFMFNQGTTWGATSYWPNSTLGLGPVSSGVAASGRFVKGNQPLTNPWDAMFSMDPEQSINYVDAHDNLCLNDKVEAWAKLHGHSANTVYKQRLQEFALSMVLTSQGIPFLHGGSEMLRDKQDDHNSYKSPDSINQYDWNWRINHAATYDFVKKVINLRKSHPGFRMNTWDEVRNNVKSDQRSASLVVTEINAAANGDTWNKALVIFNSGSDQVISLPAGTWKVALEKSSATAGNDRTVSGSITAEGTAVTVLYQ